VFFLHVIKLRSVFVYRHPAYYSVTSGTVFYIGVGAAVGTIFLIVFIAIVCFVRGRKTADSNI